MNREQTNEYHRIYNPKYYTRIKTEVLGYYSNNTFLCALCGSDKNPSIDHKDLNGGEHRHLLGLNSSLQFYLWLRKNNYPDGYRVLCRRCNSINQPKHIRQGVSPSRLVSNYFKSNNASCSFSTLVSDLSPYATSERAIMMAIHRLYKKGKLTRIKRGIYKWTIPNLCAIPEPKNTTVYKPHEVASIVGCNKATLLTWERKGFIPPPKHRLSGYRDYSREDVLRIIQFATYHKNTNFLDILKIRGIIV